jgi:predicted nucleotidyltransferase
MPTPLPSTSTSSSPKRVDLEEKVDLLADLPSGLSLFGLGRLEADLEAILGSRVDLIPADDLKPGVRARVERDMVRL